MLPQKFIGIVCAVLLAAPFHESKDALAHLSNSRDQFRQYKAVEAYEIRPDILMMPRYSSDGEVCEIGLEKRHYSPDLIRHGSELTRKEVDDISDELVPATERGAKSDILAGNEVILSAGHGMTTILDYENVSIEIHAWVLQSSRKESTVEQDAAVIRWKHRKCE